MLTIALPKGRLGNQVYDTLKGAGYGIPAMEDIGRRLILLDEERGLKYLLVKPLDVAVYVEKGAADVGVAGKDVLEEFEPDVFEMLDLGFGKCSMCVAAPEGYKEEGGRKVRVATKFEHIARKYYSRIGRDAEFIHLNGSIELAPVMGLADVIVDIVETGTTLKENHLHVVDRFMDISARVIVNKASYRFHEEAVDTMIGRLKEARSK